MECFPVDNFLLLSDSYKITHYMQYPPDTTEVYSYFESRGGKFPKTLFFGIQYILKRYLSGQVITEKNIQEAKDFCDEHFPVKGYFNEAGWKRLLEKHGGRLPVRVKAVPEGTLVPTRNVLFTVENTDPEFPWVTNFLETVLVQCWYPTTVATNSFYQKKICAEFLARTSETKDGLEFMLHDFGYRGVSSVESAAIGGCAHLVNFKGTDTLAGICMARKFYSCHMAGFSIPASEHSTMTTWGPEGEKDAMKNMLDRFPEGPISVVSDSYDVFNAVDKVWGEELKDLVLKRNGRLVIRPDSGDPATVVVRVLKSLAASFGSAKNSKGYIVLSPKVRVIQGDGVSVESLPEILRAVADAGFSAENMVFGSGGALLQRLDRDTQKCAFKCSHAIVNGVQRDVYKDPVTDHGKVSKKGRLSLERREGVYVTVEKGLGDPKLDILETVFENGSLIREDDLETIRARANACLWEEVDEKLANEIPKPK